MNRSRNQRRAIRELALRRVEGVWGCLGELCPNLPLVERKAIAEKVLDLCRGDCQQPVPIQISAAQVQEIIWRNMQCANRHCSMLIFSRER